MWSASGGQQSANHHQSPILKTQCHMCAKVSVFLIVLIVNLHEISSSCLRGVIARAGETSNTFTGPIPVNWETVPLPSTPLPTIDAAISWNATPAWDPNSLTPRTRPEYDGTGIQIVDLFRLTRILALPVLPRNWLETRALVGKSVKVRIMVSQSTSGIANTNLAAEFLQYDGKAASTMGEAVNGDPPAVRVKLMSSTAPEISIPLCYLHPIHPSGVKDKVIVIAGDLENVGLEGVVTEAPGETFSWYVRLSSDVTAAVGGEARAGVRLNTIMAERRHLAASGKVRVSSP